MTRVAKIVTPATSRFADDTAAVTTKARLALDGLKRKPRGSSLASPLVNSTEVGGGERKVFSKSDFEEFRTATLRKFYASPALQKLCSQDAFCRQELKQACFNADDFLDHVG